MVKKADLHVHTHFSDGTLSPKEVVEEAKKRGISAVAIADHDSVDGIASAIEEGEKINIEVIPAIELTVEEDDTEIHILGYFIDYKNKDFKDFLKKLRQERKERTLKIISKLKKLGLDIGMEDIMKTAGPGAIGRLHIASCLKEKGYLKNTYEAFNKYLGQGKPAYVKRKRFSPQKALQLIEGLGGVSVLAHPHTIKNKQLIEYLLKMGVRGIEAYHSDHSQTTSNYFKKLAKQYDLIITGGSDCHGLRKEKILLGNVNVPYSVVEELKQKSLVK